MEKKILVLDDQEDILKILKKAFSLEGYTVFPDKSGEEALKTVREENLQVMFVDLNLPGIDGIDFCRRVKKYSPISCIFAMTGYGVAFGIAECREAGFDDFFSKPFEIKDLIKAAKDSFDKIERWER